MPAPTATGTVVRYSALLGGIVYGLVHQGTMQTKYDEARAHAQTTRRAHLIEEGKKAYAQKLVADQAGSKSELITNIDDPNFDLEKLIDSWAKTP